MLQTFCIQMFDDDLQVWVNLDDLDALPLKAKLKVIVFKVSGCQSCTICMLSNDIANRSTFFFYSNQQNFTLVAVPKYLLIFGLSSLFFVNLQPAYCIWMKLVHQCVMPLNFYVHRLLLTKKFDFFVCYYLLRLKTARKNKHFGLHLSQIQSKSGHSMQVKLTNLVILKPINFEFCRSSLTLFLPIAN